MLSLFSEEPTTEKTTTVPTVEANSPDNTTPVVSVVTPSATEEPVTKIEVTGQEEDTPVKILTPSDALKTSETLPADETKALVVDLPTKTIPQEITRLEIILKDAQIYEITSTDGTNKAVVTFTTEENKNYAELFPPTETDEPNTPTSQLFDVVVSRMKKGELYFEF